METTRVKLQITVARTNWIIFLSMVNGISLTLSILHYLSEMENNE